MIFKDEIYEDFIFDLWSKIMKSWRMWIKVKILKLVLIHWILRDKDVGKTK